MHKILSDLLKKRGIKLEDLSNDERRDYDHWNSVMTSGDTTINDVKKLCRTQIRMIEGRWADLNKNEHQNERLVVMHTVYKTILKMTKSRDSERKSMEAYLVSLLHAKQ